MLEWMEEHGFSLLNDPDVPTWRKDDHTQSSVLDLVWQNDEMAALGVLADFGVSDQVHDFSDHHTVSWVFDSGQEEVELDSHPGYNFKAAEADKFKRDFKERMDSHADVFTELRNAPKAVRNTELLERACAAMHDALSGATEATVPKKRPSKRSQPWWTPELTASRQRAHDAEIAARGGHLPPNHHVQKTDPPLMGQDSHSGPQ